MATFSDGTDHPPDTHCPEFKPTRGRGRSKDVSSHGDNSNQFDTYSKSVHPHGYSSSNSEYNYSPDGFFGYGAYQYGQYGQYSDVYAQDYREWGYRERGGTRGRARAERGKRGRGGRQFEETRVHTEREDSYPEWRLPAAASPKKEGKRKWRRDQWENKPFTSWRESNRGSNSNNRSRVNREEDVEWRSERIRGATEQTEELIQQIIELSYECVVCCEIVGHQESVWSCQECYQLFHLPCIVKWATAPNSLADYDHPENGWKCPTCRHTHPEVPQKYMCFCGAVEKPVWKKGELPHSCTEICERSLNTDPEHSQCQHRCKQLCHPGPCPTCAAMVQVACPCKKSTSEMRCNMAVNVPPCTSVCGRRLACGRHNCTQDCHHGECENCSFEIVQTCYCNKGKRTVLCDDLPRGVSVEEGVTVHFSCKQPCSRRISCGNHLCERECHEGGCGGCNLATDVITTCPCGAFQLENLVAKGEERESCLDPIPTCHSTCNKVLLCSNPGDPKCHRCDIKCHTGECSVCEKQQLIQCGCGKSRVFIQCKDLKHSKPLLPPKCEKLCNKKMLCGRHRCQDKCCTRANHPCNVICNKRLQCGHKCMEVCHTHRCPSCPNTSFDELHCYCGAEVMYPPIPCGTLPPKCEKMCTRRHRCGHTPRHNCHTEKSCPPCAELVDKLCMCGKEAVCNVPCHRKDPSCGRPCGRQLKCGTHNCTKICHRNLCQSEREACVQKCNHARKLCGHACGMPCHGRTPCPQTLCTVWVTVKCGCGRKSSQLLCPLGSDNFDVQKRIKEKGLSSVVTGILSGKKVDIGKFMELKNIASLDCDEECQKEEWKKRLADAFGVDTSSPIDQAIREMYNPYLKEQARLEPEFVSHLEDQICRLIHSVQASQSKSQQYVCRVMRPHQRQIVHELASYYNCQTWSQDPEPQRQVVILATKSSIIPSTSLTDLANPSKRLKKPL